MQVQTSDDEKADSVLFRFFLHIVSLNWACTLFLSAYKKLSVQILVRIVVL